MQRGTFQLMKSVNKSLILNKIRESEPISRAQIAKETELTPPTVSSIVKELIEQGLVVESSLGASSGGRKPMMLHINSQALYVIGVDVSPEKITGALTDLKGKIYKRTVKKLIQNPTNEQFIELLKKTIYSILQESTVNTDKIIGIGIAMHGVVDVENGVSLVAPNMGLRDIPIKVELEKEFNLTIKVENDARAMALGESWFGGYGNADSLVAVNIGRGVGSGLVVNGKLYHGAQDIAGEIGHMTVDIYGEKCECGNLGCLQTFVSGNAISKRASHVLGSEVTGEQVYQLALDGDETSRKILRETGEIIGIGLINLIHLINPSHIVLGGGVMKSEKFFMPVIKQTIERRALTTDAKNTKVAVTKLGDDATLMGAVSLLLVEFFDPVL